MSDPRPIEVESVTGLKELVEEIRAEGTPRILRGNGENLAVIVPLPKNEPSRGKRRISEEDYLLFLSSAGSWRNVVDAERFLKGNYESRRRSSRPHIEL